MTPVAAVPDGEGAAGVVDEARLVEAVAPGRVLERALADRRPEAGHRRPTTPSSPASRGRRSRPVQRLAPVLDAQRSPGGALCAPQTSPAASTSTAAVRIAASAEIAPSSVSSSPSSDASARAGRTPTATITRSAPTCRSPATTSRRPGSCSIRSTSVPASSSTPVLAQPAGDPPAAASPSRADVRRGLVGDQRHVVAAHRERGRGLAADEPGADDHDLRRAGEPALDLADVVERPQHAHGRVVGARHGQPPGLGAGGEHAALEAELVAVGERRGSLGVRAAARRPSHAISSTSWSTSQCSSSIGSVGLARSRHAAAPSSAAAACRGSVARR